MYTVHVDDITSIILFLFLCYIKQIDSPVQMTSQCGKSKKVTHRAILDTAVLMYNLLISSVISY